MKALGPVAALLLLGMAAPVTAYAPLPLELLQQDSEYAHARFEEDRTPGDQTSWGRGIMATITIKNTCNRNDIHDLAHWVSIFVYDSDGNDAAAAQAGFVQKKGVCDTAEPFAQMCRSPCGATGVYEPPIWGHQIAVPDDGLAGSFRIFLVRPATGPNPMEPCIARMLANLPCPIAMTQAEYNEGMCASLDSTNVDCEIFNEELSFVASGIDICEGLAGPVVSALANDCQAVDAARLILDHGIEACESPEDFLDAAYDVPVCIRPDYSLVSAAAPDQAPAAPTCSLVVYYDGAAFADYPGMPCDLAAFSYIEYEAAANYAMDPHSGPGSTDKATMYTSWASIGTASTSSIPVADKTWRTTLKATCPPYESKFAAVNSLVNWAEIGPNIDGSNNRCDFQVTSTPGLGFAAAASIPLLAAFAYRRLSARMRAK